MLIAIKIVAQHSNSRGVVYNRAIIGSFRLGHYQEERRYYGNKHARCTMDRLADTLVLYILPIRPLRGVYVTR